MTSGTPSPAGRRPRTCRRRRRSPWKTWDRRSRGRVRCFAIGLNYSDHAAESGFQVPDAPTVIFTKWVSCLTGPVTEVVLPDGGHTDWQVGPVAVIDWP